MNGFVHVLKQTELTKVFKIKKNGWEIYNSDNKDCKLRGMSDGSNDWGTSSCDFGKSNVSDISHQKDCTFTL